MRLALIAIAVVLGLTTNALAQQPVDAETVKVLREMAMTPGKTSAPQPKTDEEIAKEAEEMAKQKARIESSRKAFFERTYSKKAE